MTYKEIQEITNRLEPLGELTLDVQLDSTKLDGQPEFYYYGVEIGSYSGDKTTTVVKLTINEHPDNRGIWLYKCNYDYIYKSQRQEQQQIYDTCQQIVNDYLNDNLLKGEVEE